MPNYIRIAASYIAILLVNIKYTLKIKKAIKECNLDVSIIKINSLEKEITNLFSNTINPGERKELLKSVLRLMLIAQDAKIRKANYKRDINLLKCKIRN